jgi:hypothetical protein
MSHFAGEGKKLRSGTERRAVLDRFGEGPLICPEPGTAHEVDRQGASALSASSILSRNASTVSVCSNARDKVELLSQTPGPHAERVLAAGELAIGGQIVLF